MLLGLTHHTSSHHGHRASLPAVQQQVTTDADRFALLRSLIFNSDALGVFCVPQLHLLLFVMGSRPEACHALVILRRSRDQLRAVHSQLLFLPSSNHLI